MKRLVWILLAAFCTALAQVRPVDVPLKVQETCGCCEEPGACGMSDCAPLPVASQPSFVVQAPASQRAEARRLTPAPRIKHGNFHATFAPRPALKPALPAPRVAAMAAASEPLFRVHCSYLL
jgi:hypothetical protein